MAHTGRGHVAQVAHLHHISALSGDWYPLPSPSLYTGVWFVALTSMTRAAVQEEDMDKYIDLSAYINTSSLTVTENFSLGFTYNLFRFVLSTASPPKL